MGFKFEGINWDDIAAQAVIPEGRYPARVDDVEQRTSEEGNEYLNVTFSITEGELEGRKVWGVFMKEPQHLWKMRQLCEAAGIDLAGRDDFDTDELKDLEVGIIVKNRIYQGAERSSAQGFFSLFNPSDVTPRG